MALSTGVVTWIGGVAVEDGEFVLGCCADGIGFVGRCVRKIISGCWFAVMFFFSFWKIGRWFV